MLATVGSPFGPVLALAEIALWLYLIGVFHIDSDGTELFLIGGLDMESENLIGLTDEHLDAVLHGDLHHTNEHAGLGIGLELGELPAGKYLFLLDGIETLTPGTYDSIPLNGFAVLKTVP